MGKDNSESYFKHRKPYRGFISCCSDPVGKFKLEIWEIKERIWEVRFLKRQEGIDCARLKLCTSFTMGRKGRVCCYSSHSVFLLLIYVFVFHML